MTNRKIISITKNGTALIALCDDNTIWSYDVWDPQNRNRWQTVDIPTIPPQVKDVDVGNYWKEQYEGVVEKMLNAIGEKDYSVSINTALERIRNYHKAVSTAAAVEKSPYQQAADQLKAPKHATDPFGWMRDWLVAYDKATGGNSIGSTIHEWIMRQPMGQ